MPVSRPSTQRRFWVVGRPIRWTRIGLAVRRLDDVAMAGALHFGERRVLGGEDVLDRMGLVRPVDIARAREGDGVVVARAALGGQQVVPGPPVLAGALVEMRALDQLQLGALVDVLDRPDELSLRMVVFLQRDAGEAQRPGRDGPTSC